MEDKYQDTEGSVTEETNHRLEPSLFSSLSGYCHLCPNYT